MKKIFTLLLVISALFCLKPEKAQAQLPYVSIQYAGDSSWNYNCSVPDTVNMFIYGVAAGYQPTDSIHIEIAFGDGTDSSYYMTVIQGSTFYDFGIIHVYTTPGVYSAQFIVTGPDGSTDTTSDNSILVAAQCGDISGQLYLDANGDCIFNTGDTPIQNYVEATYNGQMVGFAYSDSLGYYNLSVPAGFTYDVFLPYLNGLNVTCPVSGSYTITTTPATGIDFGLACNAQWDLTGYIGGQGFRNNAATTVWVTAVNQLISCAPPTATITIDLDPMLSYVSSSSTPVSVSSTQVVFNAGQLGGWNAGGYSTGLTLLTNIAANLGDTLCLTMTVDPVAGDVDATDNVITVCLPVRNSCDPNEKYEIHAGATSATVAPGTKLDYTIMFQNIGNDEAYDINVIDELDANLDLSTLKITGASHDYNFYFSNNTLKFEFKNINLAAASVNEPMSHGFVSYTIEPKSTVALGTSILNTAEIFFDFNAPIVTNTVENIINITTGLKDNNGKAQLNLYPNPADNYFVVATGSTSTAVLTIYDITGRNMVTQLEVMNQQKVNTENLSSGMYFVTLVIEGNTYSAKLSIK